MALQAYQSSKVYAILTPRYEAGMFSHFLTVLGYLEYYENGKYSGVKVDFENLGLYYEAKQGPNWWEYYFEPIAIGDKKNSVIQKHGMDENARAAYFAIDLPRQRSYDLIQKYIKVKPFFMTEIEQYIEKSFTANSIIGVHYRGTDKVTSGEARLVTYHEIAQEIVNLINKNQLTDYQIFIATDEWNFIYYMFKCFPDRILYQECTRSLNNQPVHIKKVSPFQIGKEALLDALLLARCDYLIRTSSNLSLCSSFFNPYIPVQVLYGKK